MVKNKPYQEVYWVCPHCKTTHPHKREALICSCQGTTDKITGTNEVDKLLGYLRQLKTEVTKIENSLELNETKLWVNITKDVTISPEFDKRKIRGLNFLHRCWYIGNITFTTYPEIKCTKKNYKIKWTNGQIQILWNGTYGS